MHTSLASSAAPSELLHPIMRGACVDYKATALALQARLLKLQVAHQDKVLALLEEQRYNEGMDKVLDTLVSHWTFRLLPRWVRYALMHQPHVGED